MVALVLAGLVFIGSIVAIVVLGAGQGWFASDSGDGASEDVTADDPEPTADPQSSPEPTGPIMLPNRLDLRLVTETTPGECPADTAGDGNTVTVTDGPTPECLELGGGFFVIELAEVTAAPSSQGAGHVVAIEFLPETAETLAELTEENVGERMVFTYADEVITHAMIAGPITGGRLEVTANMTADEADELAARIRGD